jgi:ABC-type bacteriocin/lantibiotic exporter with double-glycine peptidase domain
MKDKILTPYRRLIRLIQVDKKDIYNIYVYAIFLGITNLSLPLGIQAIINLIQMGQISTSWIVLVFIVILGILFGGFLQIMQRRITENLQQKLFVRASFEFAFRIPRFNLSTINSIYAPEYVNRFFDTMTVQKGLPKLLIDLSSAILQIIFSLILLSLYHPFFIIFSLALLLILFFLLNFTGKRGLSTSIKESKYKYAVAHWLEEIARTMNTFKLAGKTNLPAEKTDKLVQSYLEYREKHFKVLLTQFVQLISFKAFIALGLLVIGGLLVINQQMNIGQFIAAEIIILLVISSVEKIIVNLENLYDVLTALDKIGQVTDLPLEKDSGKPLDKEQFSYPMEISMKNVKFKYPDQKKYVLKDLNLEIQSRKHTAIIGDNGSGKTSILNILAGLYPINEGSFSYNGLPCGEVNLEEIRGLIGDIISEEQLFRGTIEENITMGKLNVNFQDVQWAVKQVGLNDFMDSLANGYATEIDPNGKRFPRSITHKIILARSIVDRPKLLLMDDVQGFLNVKTDEKLFNFLSSKDTPWTLIAAVSNKEWLSNFENIIVVEEGKTIFSGTYTEYQKFTKS